MQTPTTPLIPKSRISDTEVGHLIRMMCEIFGEECHVETFVWQSIFRPSNMSRRVRRNAEYVACFSRRASDSTEFVERYEDPQGEASLTQNNNAVRTLEFPPGSLVVNLPDGRYEAGVVGDVRLETDLLVHDRRNSEAFRISGSFKWSQQYLDDEIAKGVFLVIKTHTFIPYYRKDYQKTALRPTKILPRDIVGDVLQANAELDQLGLAEAFDYPKPTSLLRQLMTMTGIGDDDIVLDFFAGSASTGHAVMGLFGLPVGVMG
ncbi:DNA methyltransferase [Microbacterium sp. NPDC003461]